MFFFYFVKGVECCSETSISFHYTPPEQIQRLAMYLEEKKRLNNNNYNPLNFTDVYMYLTNNKT